MHSNIIEKISNDKPENASVGFDENFLYVKAMTEESDIYTHAAVAARLRSLRLAMGIQTILGMAQRLGISMDRYYKAETQSLSREVAMLICQRFRGVTLDWLYFGREDMLPTWLSKSLAEERSPKDTRVKRGGKGR